MRVSIVSILLAGGMLVMGGCSTSVEPGDLTVAALTDQCRGVARAETVPTGRKTGDARNDYRCQSVHAGGFLDRRDRNVVSAAATRSAAIDRSLKSGN